MKARVTALTLLVFLQGGTPVDAAPAREMKPLNRADAQMYLRLRVTQVSPVRKFEGNRLEVCAISGQVVAAKWRPESGTGRSHPPHVKRGQSLKSRLPCWSYDGWRTAPLAGRRIHYGGPLRVLLLDTWGTFVDKDFVVYDFRPAQ
ncbi:MAG: hypothetical protein AAF493_12950 [Pseudomonadota bacterium]